MAALKPDDIFLFEDLLDEEDRLIMETARTYSRTKLEPRALEGNQQAVFDPAIATEMGELGLLGVMIDPAYGGAGAGPASYGVVARELERVDSAYRSFASVQSSLVMAPIERFGSDEQRATYLPRLASGELIGCFGLTEPDHGSDPASMETTARRADGGWVLNGAKMWITNSPIAHVAIVWARTVEPDGAKGPVRGFVVQSDVEGYAAPETHNKMSLRASVTGEIVLQDVFVGDEGVLPEAEGLKAPFYCLNSARFGIVWGVLGAAEDCFQRARRYVLERKQFGHPLAANQLVQTKLTTMATDITQMQLMALRLAQLKASGKLRSEMISLAKRANCGSALRTARTARDMLGANGISGEYRVMHHMVNLESVNTYEGTYDIHGLIVGRALTDIQAFTPLGNG